MKACVFVLLICFHVLQRAFLLPQELLNGLHIHSQTRQRYESNTGVWQRRSWRNLFSFPESVPVWCVGSRGRRVVALSCRSECVQLAGKGRGMGDPGGGRACPAGNGCCFKGESTTKRESFEIILEFITEFSSSSLLSPNCGCSVNPRPRIF